MTSATSHNNSTAIFQHCNILALQQHCNSTAISLQYHCNNSTAIKALQYFTLKPPVWISLLYHMSATLINVPSKKDQEVIFGAGISSSKTVRYCSKQQSFPDWLGKRHSMYITTITRVNMNTGKKPDRRYYQGNHASPTVPIYTQANYTHLGTID